MSKHTKGLLRVGHSGAVVADHPIPEMSGSDATEYYGGHLVAESVTAANARRLAACWNLLHEFDTEAIEAGTFADFIGKQVYQHEIENANSGELRLSDVSLQLMAAGFAGKMKANAAENYMEFGLFHPETGHITLTVQRKEGLTPAQKLAAMTKQRDVLREALNGVLGVMNNSQGVVGWHKNGDIATWDELLPEVTAALEFVEGEQS